MFRFFKIVHCLGEVPHTEIDQAEVVVYFAVGSSIFSRRRFQEGQRLFIERNGAGKIVDQIPGDPQSLVGIGQRRVPIAVVLAGNFQRFFVISDTLIEILLRAAIRMNIAHYGIHLCDLDISRPQPPGAFFQGAPAQVKRLITPVGYPEAISQVALTGNVLFPILLLFVFL